MINVTYRERDWWIRQRVNDYSVDESASIHLGDDINGEAIILDANIFFDNLYVEVNDGSFDKHLFQSIDASSSPLFLVGERGRGKTTTLRRCLSKLPYKSVILDYHRILRIPVKLKNKALIAEFVNERIKNYIFSSLFPNVNNKAQFYSWLLAGNDVFDNISFPLLTAFDNSQFTLEGRIDGLSKIEERSERVRHIYDYITSDIKIFEEINKQYNSTYNIAHISVAYCRINGLNKIIIAHDNVDWLPMQYQAAVVANSNKDCLEAGGMYIPIVAIRRENTHIRSILKSEFNNFAKIVAPDNDIYSGLLLPPIKNEHAQNVIKKRNKFCDSVIARLDHSKDEENYNPTDIRFIYDKAASEFIDSVASGLTNDSVRLNLEVMNAFCRFIWTIQEERPKDFRRIVDARDEEHVETLFYVWLSENALNAGISIYNTLDALPKSKKVIDIDSSVSASYLVLACIYNLQRDLLRRGAFPACPLISDVFDYMSEINVRNEVVRGAIERMISRHGGAVGAVELYDRDIIVDKQDCEDDQDDDDSPLQSLSFRYHADDRIMLTSAGFEVFERLQTKIGYIWTIAMQSVIKEGQRKSYLEYTREQRAEHIFNYIKGLIPLHLQILNLIGQSMSKKYKDKWFEYYLERYTYGRMLIVERLLKSASAFYRHLFADEHGNPFNTLHDIHSRCVTKLVRDGKISCEDINDITWKIV